MIRERRLQSITFNPGQTVSVELSKDAIYHQLQVELDGAVTIVYPNSAGTSVATRFAPGFPFSLINRLRLLRNGSDTVWQGSGKQLAKEMLFLNGRFPFSRLWVDTSSGNGTPQSLLTKAVNGVTIPANSEGIGCNNATFTDTAANNSTSIIDFRCMLELWLQLGVDEKYFTTLLDARPLSSFTIEVTWANQGEYLVPGTQNGTNATVSVACNCSVQSYDQDNVQNGIAFGTFKRASVQVPGLGYSGTNVQYLLPRGNLFYGVILESLGLKAAGLVTIPEPGNDIITEIINRMNSNYALRDVFWRDLQAKNRNDGLVPTSPYDTWGGGPLGWAAIYYPCTGDSIKELIATYTMDQFDLAISTNGLTGGGDGNTYNGTPTLNILTQEVIPGKSTNSSTARGAFAGSIAATSAKPGL